MNNILGSRIKELRLQHNYTQKDLAEKLYVTPKMISFYELGQRAPSDDVKIEICKIFNVSLDYLLGISNIKNPYEDKKNNYIPETLAAHFDGDEFSEEDLEDIENFIEFVKQRKKVKNKE